ncbi:MAG: Holliday junction branch migration protein RuvA, partial [Acidobacteriota bacterium]
AMIGWLRGTLRSVEPSRVLLETGGVGYDVHVPLSTYYELQKVPSGEAAEVYVHTHVREDALVLYGFKTDRERQLFLRLVGVSGIGPKLAQTILSGMPGDELIDALARSDLPRLNRIPGVGKKTAERMVLELREKVKDLAPETSVAASAPQDDDLVQALTNLGYKQAAAEKAVLRVDAELPFADRLRATLRLLSKV